MEILDKYLNKLKNQESIFPMDSVHSGKLPNKKVIYGKGKIQFDQDNEESEESENDRM